MKKMTWLIAALAVTAGALAWAGSPNGPGLPFISSSSATYRVIGEETDQKLHALIGKPALVVFWAGWCIPCLHEVPHLNHLQQQYGAAGLKILAMNIDEGADANVKHLARKFEMIYPVAKPSPDLVRDFGVQAIPAAFLYGPDGALAQSWLGPVSAQEIEKYITKWLPKAKTTEDVKSGE
jgi:thiol-disulfide isomerase/thioredoxin